MRYCTGHEHAGWPSALCERPGGLAPHGGEGRAERQDAPGRGGAPGGSASSGGSVGWAGSPRRTPRAQRPATRTTSRRDTAALASRPTRQSAGGSTSRPAQVAVLPVDTGSRRATDRTALWPPVVGLDGRPLFGAMGFYPAETHPSGVRTEPGGGAPLAAAGGPGHSGGGPTGAGDDLLGGRDGDAFGPPSRDLLWASRPYAGHPWNRAAFSLQHALRHHQPGPAQLHGLQTAIHRARVPGL